MSTAVVAIVHNAGRLSENLKTGHIGKSRTQTTNNTEFKPMTTKTNKPVRLKPGSVLGTYGKALHGLSLNFDVSAGPNCDTGCPHHPQSTAPDEEQTNRCYAVILEARPDRSQLLAKLQRNGKLEPHELVARALLELQNLEQRGKLPDWLRFSTDGSVPNPDRVTALFITQLRALLSWCRSHCVRVHFPVETKEKAQFYRRSVGDLVIIRESAVSHVRFLQASEASSAVAGEFGTPYRARIEAARSLAAEKRDRGARCIVCPAVVAGFKARMKNGRKNDRAKCGPCDACARDGVHVVYPLH